MFTCVRLIGCANSCSTGKMPARRVRLAAGRVRPTGGLEAYPPIVANRLVGGPLGSRRWRAARRRARPWTRSRRHGWNRGRSGCPAWSRCRRWRRSRRRRGRTRHGWLSIEESILLGTPADGHAPIHPCMEMLVEHRGAVVVVPCVGGDNAGVELVRKRTNYVREWLVRQPTHAIVGGLASHFL